LSTLHEILHSTTLIEDYAVSHFSSTPKSLYRYLEIALSLHNANMILPHNLELSFHTLKLEWKENARCDES
jgi:hypothetical protein